MTTQEQRGLSLRNAQLLAERLARRLKQLHFREIAGWTTTDDEIQSRLTDAETICDKLRKLARTDEGEHAGQRETSHASPHGEP